VVLDSVTDVKANHVVTEKGVRTLITTSSFPACQLVQDVFDPQ
jgi:hypothetical protein